MTVRKLNLLAYRARDAIHINGQAAAHVEVKSAGLRHLGGIVPPQPGIPTTPQRRSTYIEAVALYERGLEAVQRHDYRGAIDLLESVLRQYPEEKNCTSGSGST